MSTIGFDLDGVLADQTVLKVQKFKELYGLNLERWQVSSNVIDDYVPDKTIRRAVGKISGTTPHQEFVESATPDYLSALVQEGYQLHLVSRRGKSEEGIRSGYETIETLDLRRFFKDRINFCVTDDEKVRLLRQISCQWFIDDRVEVVDQLVGEIENPVLYDPFSLVEKGYVTPHNSVTVVKSLSLIQNLARGLK